MGKARANIKLPQARAAPLRRRAAAARNSDEHHKEPIGVKRDCIFGWAIQRRLEFWRQGDTIDYEILAYPDSLHTADYKCPSA